MPIHGVLTLVLLFFQTGSAATLERQEFGLIFIQRLGVYFYANQGVTEASGLYFLWCAREVNGFYPDHRWLFTGGDQGGGTPLIVRGCKGCRHRHPYPPARVGTGNIKQTQRVNGLGSLSKKPIYPHKQHESNSKRQRVWLFVDQKTGTSNAIERT